MATERLLRSRRAVLIALSLLVPAIMVLGFGHRGAHMARNIIFPGAGLIDERPFIALVLMVLAVVATLAWVRWGVDWSIVAIIMVSTAAAGALTSSADHQSASDALRSTHEFPLVIIVTAAITWVRSVGGRMPGMRRLARRRTRSLSGLSDIDRLSVIDRCRCASIVALAAPTNGVELDRVLATLEHGDIADRARRVGFIARGRRGGDPFRIDHAQARAALALNGRLSLDDTARFMADAADAPAGVPASEPGWVRPLDATLAAVALERAGDTDAGPRWTRMLRGSMSLRRGCRPAFWWTPLGVSAGSAPPWEHAAFTGIARAMRWVGDDDWTALRPRVLGAAARGTGSRHDERLIAGGRVWLAFVDDEQAARIVARPTVRHDPIAVALDRLANRLMADPGALRTPRIHQGLSVA
jgi:hypothetical protein